MPLMVTPRKVATESGVRPKGPAGAKPAKKAPKGDPKSVKEATDRLRRLGPYPIVTGPYDAEDYDNLTRRRLDWITQHKRLLAQKHDLGKKTDNDAIQAKHTVDLAGDDSAGQQQARKNATRVRQSHAWRYNQLDGTQRQAEIEMESAWRSRIAGFGPVTAKYGALGGRGEPFTAGADMEKAWIDWAVEALREAADGKKTVNISPFIDCLIEPKTLKDVERDHRLEPGDALANYQKGLHIWCRLRSWVR
jgi:hypothetical protein